MNEYYTEQAGSGIATFTGQRYQKGHGMLGRFFTGSVMPLLKKVLPFLGKQALSLGADFANEWKTSGNLGNAAKKSLKRGGLSLAEEAMSKFKDYAQEGDGVKRRRTVSTTSHIKLKKPQTRKKKKKPKSTKINSIKEKSSPTKKKAKKRKKTPSKKASSFSHLF